MNFLYPGFLFSLAAIAIPIVIHLFNFRKFRKVYFSNVHFLKQVEQKTSSRQKLKNLLILASRILAIIFLVLAFSKPYIPSKETLKGSVTPVISVYIDNSYSMETVNKEGALLDEAKRRAKEIVSVYSLNDRFQLITNDFEGKHQRLLSREDFLTAVDEVKISPETRRLQALINWQQQVLKNEGNAGKVAYFISDFQSNMLGNENLQVDSSIDIRLIRLRSNALANISVDSAWFISPIHKPGDTEKLVVQLKNNSDEKSANIPIKLLINKQQKAIGSLSLAARKTGRDTLSFSGLQSGWQQGEIQIADYPLVFDDTFYFTFYTRKNMSVLAVNDQQVNPYLEAVYRVDPFFNLSKTTAGNIDYSSLQNYQLIVLNNFKSVTPGLSQQLTSYVKDGGNLMIFPAIDTDLPSFKNLLQSLGTDIPMQVVNTETKVSSINLQHPVFKNVFEQIPRNMDLPVAKKYIQYSNQSKTSKQNLLSFPGGRSFLSRYSLGKGKVYLSAVALDAESGNFVQHAIFVPIMYQAAFLSLRDNPLFYVLGRDQFLETNKISLSANQALKLKKDNFETIPDLQQTENTTRLFVADQIQEQGNYQLFKADSLLGIFAFNNNRTESDLSYISDAALKDKFPGQKVEIFNPGKESVQNAIKAADSGTQLWKLCIILALISLAAEVLLIRFYKNQNIKTQVLNGNNTP